ncbi:MAG: hypothetical protein LUG23_01825 [Oscillospiraceae bacterium]|nr:hypothetical protein [Oscillospiraceae bacterium]
MKRVSKKVMVYFAMGQLGWSILSGIITNLLVNFYLCVTAYCTPYNAINPSNQYSASESIYNVA